MIGASKILTVSYGTFSCTLEGFDDPFNTMKAIAEYFRDLAAEDRYFGAEPPTPDAAMLHRIAEREIQRRVEAKIQDNGVILRAGEDLAPAPAPALIEPTRPEAPAEAPVRAAPAAPVVAAPEPAAEPAAEPTPAPVAVEPAVAEAPPVSESVAAKLARIRSAVASSQATVIPAPGAPRGEPTDYSEDQHADVEAATEAAGTLAAILEAEEAEEAEPVSPQPASIQPVTAEPAAEAIPLPEEDAGHFATLAAEEAEGLLPEDAPSAVIEDEPVPAFPEALVDEFDDEIVAEATAPIPGADAWDRAAASSVGLEDEADDLSGILSSLQTEAPADTHPAALDALGDLDDFEDLEDEQEQAGFAEEFADDFEDLASDLPAPASDAQPEAEPETATEAVAAKIEDAAFDEEAEEDLTEDRPSALDKLKRARARVIKIRRAEPAPVETAEAPASPAPDVEADLIRELAAAQHEPAQQPARTVMPTRPVAGEGRRRMDEKSPDTGEAAVSRLIAQTNSEMEGPENRRRLSAIAHLKAAVVATVAERLTGGHPQPSDEDRIDPYRNDLSRIVRPTSPATPTGAAASDRPAPLVLVSEQRIDRRASDRPVGASAAIDPNRGPVRPRRVASTALAVQNDLVEEEEDEDEDDEGAENIFTDAKGFAEFADRLGARNLPELLEAAAAYTACVEGRPYFSRPYLIRQVSTVSPEAGSNRENSLRGFGTLLRDGKIQKVKRGQYALTESSHYLSEARKLVG